MKNLIFAFFIFTTVLFTACGSGQQTESTNEAHADSSEQEKPKAKIKVEMPVFDSTKIEKEKIAPIVKAYLSLKDAFVASNFAETQKMATELSDAISGEALQSLKADAEQIKQATDIEAQRAIFYPLSAKLFILVKTFGGNTQALHQQYCPMAFDNQGAYWLSDKSEIRNPYFGDQMLGCGMINETLAAK
jgi:hypothetical protein